jgi:hypothetical protein
MTEEYHIELGGVYEYTSPFPAGCKGHHYTVIAFATLVPVYQDVVVVQVLTGRDQGQTIVCSHANFVSRYARVPLEELPVVEKEVAPTVEKWRTGA